MHNIKISVVIPIYNRANTLARCLTSVTNQTYQPAEIIAIDDGSTDDSIKTIRHFDSNIRIIRLKKNFGAQKARNEGIKNAKYGWIAFIDSDDEWLPNKLEKQISALKAKGINPMTVVHSDCYKKNIDSDNTTHWQLEKIDGENVYKNLLSKSGTLFPSILTSKQALEIINFLDENVPSYHEWDTAIRLAKYCRFIHIQEPLFIYNIHQNTISKNSDTSVEGYQYIINKHKAEIIKLCGIDTYDRHLMTSAILAMNSGDFINGEKFLREIHRFSIKIMLLNFCTIFHLKPKYPMSLKSYIKG